MALAPTSSVRCSPFIAFPRGVIAISRERTRLSFLVGDRADLDATRHVTTRDRDASFPEKFLRCTLEAVQKPPFLAEVS